MTSDIIGRFTNLYELNFEMAKDPSKHLENKMGAEKVRMNDFEKAYTKLVEQLSKEIMELNPDTSISYYDNRMGGYFVINEADQEKIRKRGSLPAGFVFTQSKIKAQIDPKKPYSIEFNVRKSIC